MNRRSLLVIVILIFIFLISACGGKNQTATSKTQEAAQATEPTPTQSAGASSAAETEKVSQTAPTAAPTVEPTQAPTAEQPASTQSTSTGETATDAPPAAAPTQSTASTETTTCLNKAAFYEDVTVPDDTVMRQGDKFTKTWRIKNEGDCTWKDYKLTYAGGEAMNAAPSNPVPEAAPGSIIDISVDMTAPGRGGTYLSYWQFSSSNGQTFGVGSGANGLLWARIQVDYTSGDTTTVGTTNTTSPSTSTTNTTVSSSPSTNTTNTNANNSTSTPSNSIAGCNYSLNADYENQILDLINKARADNGLEALTRNAELDAAALEHSMDMACNDLLSHTGSDGSLWYDRVAKHGFANSRTARENIYTGSPDFGGDANGAFTWWMNSKVHRDNILYSTVTEVGISYVYSKKATYGGLYTLVLARP